MAVLYSINLWNLLSRDVMTANSIDGSKGGLVNFMAVTSIIGYEPGWLDITVVARDGLSVDTSCWKKQQWG